MNWDWQYWRIKQLRGIIRACEIVMRNDEHAGNQPLLDYAQLTWDRTMKELQRLQLATFDRG